MLTTCKCPQCASVLSLREEDVGKRAVCPKCMSVFHPTRISLTPDDAYDAITGDPPLVRSPARAAGTADPRVTASPSIRGRQEGPNDEPESGGARFLGQGLPGRGLTTAAMILIGVVILVDGVDLLLAFLRYRLIASALEGDVVDPAQVRTYVQASRQMHLLASPVIIANVVVFCMWTYRAYKNLYLLGARGLSHSAGWAVGFLFIPIVNLCKPYFVYREMWKASERKASLEDPYAWKTRSGGVWVSLWWAARIIALLAVIGDLVNLGSRAQTLEEMQTRIVGASMGYAMHMVSGMLAILVIHGIRQRQTRTYELLAEMDGRQGAGRV
jgi:hypothetical protein